MDSSHLEKQQAVLMKGYFTELGSTLDKEKFGSFGYTMQNLMCSLLASN